MYCFHPFVQNIYWLIPVRIVLGLSYGIIVPVLFTQISKQASERNKGGLGTGDKFANTGSYNRISCFRKISHFVRGEISISCCWTLFYLTGVDNTPLQEGLDFFQVLPVTFKEFYKHKNQVQGGIKN